MLCLFSDCFIVACIKSAMIEVQSNDWRPQGLYAVWGKERIRGIDFIYVFDEGWFAPVGIIWGTQLGEKAFVLHHAYTVPVARKRGVYATALRALFEEWGFEKVLTHEVTVAELGWRQCRDIDMYVLSKKSFDAYCKQKKDV